MARQSVDFIIVGSGLAGSCLYIQLAHLGWEVALFDEPEQNRSSAIAAGLFNPITNQVMNKTWRAGEFFDSLHAFYPRAEKMLGESFYFPMDLYRPFGSVEEQNTWMARSAEPEVSKFIKSISLHSTYRHQINDPFGGLLVNYSGYIQAATLMSAVRQHAQSKGLYFQEALDTLQLATTPSVIYKTISAKAIIFCEGTAVKKNPYFQWLPIKSLKGETLEIEAAGISKLIFNSGVYMVPGTNNRFKVGATYQHNAPPGVSEEGKRELTEKLDDLLKARYEIVSQNWGYRPTIIDRKPVLGPHPQHSNVLVFNGLGTKGVSLAPHFSGVLAGYLAGTKQIEKDVNISRFYTLYSKF